MKILLTLRQPLFPADIGGRIRSLGIFSRLAKRAEIHVVSLAHPDRDASAISQMKSMFHSCIPVYWREPDKYSARFYWEITKNQFSSLPYFLAKCNVPRLRSAVEEFRARTPIDLLLCDFLQTALPLVSCNFRPRILFQHNVEFLLRKRKWSVEANPIRKRVFANEWRKTRSIESQVCRSFDHVLAVSGEDRLTMEREFGLTQVSTIPTGVDTDFFRPAYGPVQRGRIVFVGAMDWDPNEDGAIWFLREVYPRVRQSLPYANFLIVGRSPSSRLRSIAAKEPGVELTGRVPDVRPYLADSEVVVVPLRAGGGTRLKIPEAMAMGKAVISTTVGAEGLPFRNLREIWLEDQPNNFAEAIVELLKNATRRQAIECSAREVVVRNHSWESVVDELETVLHRVLPRAKETLAIA